jgi:Uma2 family endonuclease
MGNMANLAQANLRDERLYETINGRITNMSPLPFDRHATVTLNIAVIFGNYLRGKKCKIYKEDKYVRLDKTDIDFSKLSTPVNKKITRLVPDIVVVCNPDIIKNDGLYGAPDLVAEVLSKTTSENDKGIKKEIYEAIGVKEYWIVDTNNKSVEVYLLKDGKYILDKFYSVYTDEEMQAWLEDKENGENVGEIITEFKTSIFDDLTISLEDVFEKI